MLCCGNHCVHSSGNMPLERFQSKHPEDDDEASFLRLIAWSYVFIFEAGRVTIPYLLKLPLKDFEDETNYQATCDLVHDLRTWSFHNLSFFKSRELSISKRTAVWFVRRCGTNPPRDVTGWRSCFECLCANMVALLKRCRLAVDGNLVDGEYHQEIVVDLQRRLNRNWPAHRFDAIVGDVASRIGERLDASGFRELRISKWREFLLTIPDGDDPERSMVRLIERDVLDHFEAVLPIDGNDVMLACKLDPGPQVGRALKSARQLYREGITAKHKLLGRLQDEFCR